jgi:hypothetical protein
MTYRITDKKARPLLSLNQNPSLCIVTMILSVYFCAINWKGFLLVFLLRNFVCPTKYITGVNRFFFVRDFHDMRCKYDKVLSIIHQQLNRKPEDGNVFIVTSKDLRLVRLFSYDRRSYSMFEKRFRSGYQFMQATYNGAESILPYYECRQ